MVTPSPGAQQWSMKLEFMCQEQATGCTVVMNALAVTLALALALKLMRLTNFFVIILSLCLYVSLPLCLFVSLSFFFL